MACRRNFPVHTVAALLLVGGFSCLSSANASGVSSRSDMSLQVPLVCGLAQIGAADAASVMIHEMCNSGGAKVIVHHDPSIGERAVFTYAGVSTWASRSGVTYIFAIGGASNTLRRFSVKGVGAAELERLSLSIIPDH